MEKGRRREIAERQIRTDTEKARHTEMVTRRDKQLREGGRERDACTEREIGTQREGRGHGETERGDGGGERPVAAHRSQSLINRKRRPVHSGLSAMLTQGPPACP